MTYEYHYPTRPLTDSEVDHEIDSFKKSMPDIDWEANEAYAVVNSDNSIERLGIISRKLADQIMGSSDGLA